MSESLPINTLLEGDCIEIMKTLSAESVDLVFADPPYNLQLRQELWRPNQTLVDAVKEPWDQFSSFSEYDDFTQAWLSACRRILKPTGTLWVIGMYHNIHRIGVVLQNLDYWILNSVVWIKSNPMPNFRGVRFTNAHETLLWAQKQAGQPYTFNHRALKELNDDLQMRSDWYMPICNGRERLRVNGAKVHATQKPEALLYRVLMASTNPGDVVLDPFFGTGTTGVVARKLQRNWIGIEKDPKYIRVARDRIENTPPGNPDPRLTLISNPRKAPRLPFGALLENGLLQPGQCLYFNADQDTSARIMADGSLEYQNQRGSIHQIAKYIRPGPGNGWTLWYYLDADTRQLFPIDRLREQLRELINLDQQKETSK